MTTTFVLKVDTDNDAFTPEPASEVARILRGVADSLEAGEDFSHYRTLFDANGNDVGRAAFKEGGRIGT